MIYMDQLSQGKRTYRFDYQSLTHLISDSDDLNEIIIFAYMDMS